MNTYTFYISHSCILMSSTIQEAKRWPRVSVRSYGSYFYTQRFYSLFRRNFKDIAMSLETVVLDL